MTQRTLRKLTCGLMALMLAMALPVQALADEWYLENGDITVKATETTQTVSQGATSKQDTAPVIKQNKANDNSQSTNHTVTISSEGNGKAEVTIENVNIKNPNNGAAIDVTDGSTAVINVSGQNSVEDWGSNAGVHAGSGSDVTITSQNGGSLAAYAGYGAAIGSNDKKDMNGNITISGNVVVTAESAYGAGIGAGSAGDMSGNVVITDNAQVEAAGRNVSIGACGNLSGSVTVKGNADVVADSDLEGAGIGVGIGALETLSGTIHIGEDANVTAKGGSAGFPVDEDSFVFVGSAGIGTAFMGAITENGKIQIDGNATVNATGGAGAAGVGTGSGFSQEMIDAIVPPEAQNDPEFQEYIEQILATGGMNGTITVGGSAQVEAMGTNGGASIGAGANGSMAGNVNIQDQAAVTADSGKWSLEKAENGGLRPVFEKTGEGFIGAPAGRPATGKVTIAPTAMVNGVSGTAPAVPAGQAQGAEKTFKPLYWAVDAEGRLLWGSMENKDGTLTVTVKGKDASFVATREGLTELQEQGVKTIVFVTDGLTSSFDVAEALEALTSGKLVLQHKDGKAALTLGGAEHNELLK